MLWTGLAHGRWGVGLLVASFGGVACASAEGGPWPPPSLGGREPARGPTEDPAIDPATGRPYEEAGVCAASSTRVAASARIELNEGQFVGPSSFDPWEGAYLCTLSTQGTARGTLQVELLMVDAARLTCEARGGGMVTAFAEVSVRLRDEDGATLHDGPCSTLGNISAWPGRTSLQVNCGAQALRVEAGWVEVDPIETLKNATIYAAQCVRGAD